MISNKIEYRVYVICHYDEYSQPYSVDEFERRFKCPVEALKYQSELNNSFDNDGKDELYAEIHFI